MISLHQSRFHMFWALVEEIINPHAQKEKIFTDGNNTAVFKVWIFTIITGYKFVPNIKNNTIITNK
jgi:hypothetical protein